MTHIATRVLFGGLLFALLCGGRTALGSQDSGRKATSAGLVVYRRLAAVDLAKPIPFSGILQGAKLAFQTKGKEDACFVLHDRAGNKDLRPARQVWKFTGICPHVPGYQWAGGGWAPCLYRLDLFGQDAMLWRRLQKAPPGTEFAVDFTKPESPKGRFEVRNLVIYRGEDDVPPEAPGGLAARADHEGVHLSWMPAVDNVGVSWYVVARATGQGKFAKVAQTGSPEFTDRPATAGSYRYRVLAVDYERNVGPWSREVAIQADDSFAAPKPATVATDSLYYCEHIRAVHEAGIGPVVRGSILFHGDCLHYLDRTRNHIAAIAGLLSYGCINESSQVIRPGNPSAKLVTELRRELELRPEFCVISAGMEDLHPRPFPEDEHTTPEDIRKTVENVQKMVRMCEDRGAVTIVTTLTAFGHNAPKGSPEEKLSDALANMCRENQIPVARVFDVYRGAQEAGEDYTLLQKPVDKPHPGDVMWSRGYEFLPYEPTFELGINKRTIVVKETIDQVLFTLLDRPDR